MRPSSTALSVLALLLAIGCSEPPKVTGRVTDVWGQPLPGATVLREDTKDRVTTDAAGKFEFAKITPGDLQLMAGLKGYVKDISTVTIPADKKAPIPTVDFQLWKDPPSKGFFGKGYKDLIPLPGVKVTALGTDLKELHGVKDIPDCIIPAAENPPSFLFGSDLRPTAISQLNLKLARMKFVEEEEWAAVTGTEKVTIKMWAFDKDVKFELRALLDKNTFIIKPAAPLEAGVYAFHSQDVLTGTDPGSLARYPEQMQSVNLFEIK